MYVLIHAHSDIITILCSSADKLMDGEVEPMIYYFNFESGQSSWEHPSDVFYRELVKNEIKRKEELTGIKRNTSDETNKKRFLAPVQFGSAPLDELTPSVSEVYVQCMHGTLVL